MVEARLARNGNGNGSNMESGEKTHQELEKIEQQIARLQVPTRTRSARSSY